MMAQRKDWTGREPAEWAMGRAMRHANRPSPSNVPRRWYVATVINGQGLKVVEELHARDYDAYEPRTRSWGRHGRGRRFEVSRPLFTGYLFVGVAEGQGFHRMHEIAGLGPLLGVSGSPRELPYEPIDEIRQAEIRGEFDFTRKSQITYRPGDKIAVTSAGAYQGLVGEIKRAKGGDRWQVFLDCMCIPLNLKAEEMEPVA